jgi:carbon storage regulator CsrA
MLVLSRKAGQKLQIGDNVTITILEVHGNTVRVGIEAPREIRVLRGELDSWQEPPQKVTLHRRPAMAVAS